MALNEPTTGEAPLRRRDLAVARSLDTARQRSEGRVQRFLDAGFELLASAQSGREFTVQEVVERSGQSLRSFYQYFAGKHELLLALFDEAVRSTADSLRQDTADQPEPVERVRSFVLEYYRRCLPAPGGRPSKSNPTPVLAEFSHELMTSHQTEASRAFLPLVTLLSELLEEAARAGAVRGDWQETQSAALILTTIMFSAAYAATIAGVPEQPDPQEAGERLWDFISAGIVTRH